MTALLWLIPLTLALGIAGLVLFIWSVRSGQYDDLDAAAYRILDDEPPREAPRSARASPDQSAAIDRAEMPGKSEL